MNPNDFTKMKAALARSENAVPLPLKVRVAEIITGLKRRRMEPFGILVVLGWQNRWQKFAADTRCIARHLRRHNIQQPRRAGKTSALDPPKNMSVWRRRSSSTAPSS